MLRIDKNVHVKPDLTDRIFDKILKVDNKILEATVKNFEKEYTVVWEDKNKLNYNELWKEQDLLPRRQQWDLDLQALRVKMVK